MILNERAPSYVQDLQALLETLVRTSQSAGPTAGHAPHGSVFILRADRVTAPQRDVLRAVARAVLSSRRGTLAEQILRPQRSETAVAFLAEAASGDRSRRRTIRSRGRTSSSSTARAASPSRDGNT